MPRAGVTSLQVHRQPSGARFGRKVSFVPRSRVVMRKPVPPDCIELKGLISLLPSASASNMTSTSSVCPSASASRKAASAA